MRVVGVSRDGYVEVVADPPRPADQDPGRVLTPGGRRDLRVAEICALSELRGRMTACTSMDEAFRLIRDMCDERRMELSAIAALEED